MKALKGIDYKILSELIRNSKISDRQLAKKIGVSQPTVTRRRARLEEEKLLQYTAIPNLEKLGFEIIALTFISIKPDLRRPRKIDESPILVESDEKSKEFFSKYPHIIFGATGRGFDKNTVFISFHRDYSCLVEFLRDLELEWGKMFYDVETFTVSTKSDRIRRLFDFTRFGEYLKSKK
ncbi:MAG: Lrp/AsnC family transcriptional regulator [Candidatus Bathyarchaeia archaeon]